MISIINNSNRISSKYKDGVIVFDHGSKVPSYFRV